ncbi:arylsulfatase J-like [Phlebotomus papatasi]|uniref:arylsulfatase J-like n=1 Tax=Phlebotomus papatasi TaxID=29031 RepID=UPI0024839DD0|nr:arylsulfatase J-like [Phlebotomus papatasi]
MIFVNLISATGWLLVFLCHVAVSEKYSKVPPNIIIILADDLGSHDVSFRGSSQIPTPNIDALGYQGVILNRHYVPALCSPSRAALLTGKYPINTGMQHSVILSNEPWSLPMSEKLLPEYLKECGSYRTHMVGKWHLGFAKKIYTPLQRGFDSHFGSWGPSLSYFSHRYILPWEPFFDGYDLRRNENVTYEGKGEYITDMITDEAVHVIRNHARAPGKPLFLMVTHVAPHAAEDTNPLQAPEEDVAKFGYIEDPERRVYAAMVASLDRSVGKIVMTLQETELLRNSVILFFSDNGAPTKGTYNTTGSNYPLRGQKFSPWEGAMRQPAVIWSPLIQKRHRVSDELIYMADWLPTLVSLCRSGSINDIDGMDVWRTISWDKCSPRHEIMHNIDPVLGYSSLYRNGWKYINGTTAGGNYDGWLGDVEGDDKAPGVANYIELVMKSPTWRALAPLAQKRLRVSDIKALRSQTQIKCANHKIGKSCNPLEQPCLFHLKSDPCEENNLAGRFRQKLIRMQERVKAFQGSAMPPRNVPGDPKSNPELWNDVWTSWIDELSSENAKTL